MSNGRPITSAAPAAVALLTIVFAGLWFGEIRPRFQDREYDWPGHEKPFYLPTFLAGDCPLYRAAIVSALEDHDLDLRNNVLWSVVPNATQLALGLHGEWFPKHSLGLPLLAFPFYALLGDSGLLLFNLMQIAILDLLIFLLARRYAPDSAALTTAILFAFGTLLRTAAYNFSPDILSALVVLAATLALMDRKLTLSGALFGFAVVVKWSNLTFLPIAAIWAMATMGWRPVLRLCIATAPALLALLALDWHMFGSPWITAYDRPFEMRDGVAVLVSSPRFAFDLPFWPTLLEQMVNPDKGLIRSAPPLLFVLPGFLFLAPRREAVLVGVLALSQVLFFAPYRYWSESIFGHRFLLPVVVLAAAPAAALLARLLGEKRAAPDPA